MQSFISAYDDKAVRKDGNGQIGSDQSPRPGFIGIKMEWIDICVQAEEKIIRLAATKPDMSIGVPFVIKRRNQLDRPRFGVAHSSPDFEGLVAAKE